MKKLWQKNWQLDQLIETFETQGDLLLDQRLILADVMGSIAHAIGLEKIGILSQPELVVLLKGLKDIQALNLANKFKLEAGDEDIHTKIENYLIDNYGEVGKKIHTGRSRNDQVLTAIRLYSKDQILQIWLEVLQLAKVLIKFSKQNEQALLSGYTHMQKAMPASVGMWSAAIVESLFDSLSLLKTAYQLNNQSPLGSAAGYGVPLNLDRSLTTRLLGFEKVQNNSLYCQNSRGKIEAIIMASLITVLQDINKLASDVLLFTTSEFGFFEVASELCTGSSLMPQKKNVDLAELLRSKVHLAVGNYVQIISLSTNLISGYNRDFQDTKKPLFESFDLTIGSLKVASVLVNGIKVNQPALAKSLSPEIFATHSSLKFVKQGMSFRTAYQQTSQELEQVNYDPKLVLSQSTHLGGIGNLGLDILKKNLQQQTQLFKVEFNKFKNQQSQLLKEAENYEI